MKNSIPRMYQLYRNVTILAIVLLIITIFMLSGRHVAKRIGLLLGLHSRGLSEPDGKYCIESNDQQCQYSVSQQGNKLVLNTSKRILGPENVAKNIEIKTIAWLDPPHWVLNQPDFKHCEFKRCRMFYDRERVAMADAVVAHGPRLPRDDVLRSSLDQIWIMYGMEPPYKYFNTHRLKHWTGRFNWTITYRLDSDMFNPFGYLIVTPKYTERSNQELFTLFQKKTKYVVWFVSNCKTPSRRQDYVEDLKQYIDIDIYGHCADKDGFQSESDVVRLLNEDYKFYLSFDSNLCNGYITEKFFKVFNTTSIPVVRGAVDYEEMFPEGTFVNAAKFNRAKHLGLYLKYLAETDWEYVEFVRQKNRYCFEWDDTLRHQDLRDRYGKYDFKCLLCETLHRPSERKHYKNMHEWLTKDTCFNATDIQLDANS